MHAINEKDRGKWESAKVLDQAAKAWKKNCLFVNQAQELCGLVASLTPPVMAAAELN